MTKVESNHACLTHQVLGVKIPSQGALLLGMFFPCVSQGPTVVSFAAVKFQFPLVERYFYEHLEIVLAGCIFFYETKTAKPFPGLGKQNTPAS